METTRSQRWRERLAALPLAHPTFQFCLANEAEDRAAGQ